MQQLFNNRAIIATGASPNKFIPGEGELTGKSFYCGTCDGFSLKIKELL
jgi:thioredoxin reductase